MFELAAQSQAPTAVIKGYFVLDEGADQGVRSPVVVKDKGLRFSFRLGSDVLDAEPPLGSVSGPG